ncbi:hypothetical protein B0T10DRAFT_501499 [Thelonectria olida]|uniref:Zn(2)-C6 fungal-type domain-containing protein n=1 Tax=Thelonectria olida TaxID=1576542 RepID=A0A9P8VN91_9HYPO|nr:hypothetical protein B0T10DRAFT_501499 [Thelonectria olida]
MNSSAEPIPSRHLGRSGPRSRRGCWTCRGKKVKCDEVRPTCRRCMRLDLICDYSPRTRFAGQAASSPTSSVSAGGVADNAASMVLEARQNRDSASAPTKGRRNHPGMDLPSWLKQHSAMSWQSSHMALRSPSSQKSPGSCGLDLGHEEHEAIRYFRDWFAPLYHTKNPNYSVFSILLNIARDDALVMHMVLAISLQDIDFRQNSARIQPASQYVSKDIASNPHDLGLRHYSAALRRMADVIGQGEESGNIDLDSVTSTLVLMIMYEQIHGDSRCNGLMNHLTGTCLILKRHYSPLLRTLQATPSTTVICQQRPCALTKTARPGAKKQLSQYSARLLTRIGFMDASAAFSGLGGHITGLLYKTISEDSERTDSPPPGPLESFEVLERYAYSLYRTVWGEEYPQAEMVDDIENRSVFTLLGALGQLRYMNSQLAAILSSDDPAAASQPIASIQAAIHKTGQRFAELLEVAARLSIETDHSHRLVANIRWIVPGYHAEVLEFLRLTRGMHNGLELDEEQRYALRNIMTLAVQAYRHGGDVAMLRIARPLFTAALETDDVLHREWILERFENLRQFGKHCKRAKDFLIQTIRTQQSRGSRVNVRDQFINEGHTMSLFMF